MRPHVTLQIRDGCKFSFANGTNGIFNKIYKYKNRFTSHDLKS